MFSFISVIYLIPSLIYLDFLLFLLEKLGSNVYKPFRYNDMTHNSMFHASRKYSFPFSNRCDLCQLTDVIHSDRCLMEVCNFPVW